MLPGLLAANTRTDKSMNSVLVSRTAGTVQVSHSTEQENG